MPIFNYQARTRKGEMQTGRIEASSVESATEILQTNNNLLVVSVEPAEGGFLLSRNIPFFGRITDEDLVIFFRQLAVLFEVEVPIINSLRTLAAQAKAKQSMRDLLQALAADIDGGMPLSDSMAKHPKVFSDFIIQMVRGGETAGNLDEILEYLATHQQQDYYFKGKLRGALTYPVFVFVVFIIIAVLMLVVVVPQLTGMFATMGKQLPLATQILVSSSAFLKNFWAPLIVILVAAGFFIRYLLQTPNGKAWWDTASLHVPVLGEILQKTYLFRFADSLSMLIKGGIPIVQSLIIAGNIVGNATYKAIVQETVEGVRRGETIFSTLKSYDEFPPFITQMIMVGEQSGKLDVMLKHAADFYQKEAESSLNTVSTLIQPILIVFIAAGVLVLVLGILAPIYSLSNSVGG